MTRPGPRALRIGTRGSALALVQARWVAEHLEAHGIATEITVIRTEGDDRPVDTAWGEGAFVGRIVGALLDGAVDVAVHSAKDVPTDEEPRLVIAAYPPREDPRDALVSRVRGLTLATLPEGARVGTDSPRRVAFVRALRPDLEMHPLHGNVDTRLAKLDRGETDALVLAVAGLTRLGREDRIDEVLGAPLVPSAPGQGSLAVQVRADDAEAIDAVGRLDDPQTRTAVMAERALLRATGGGCRSPIGAVGRVDGGALKVIAAAERAWTPLAEAPLAAGVTSVVRVRGAASADEALDLATRLAARLVALRDRPRVLLGRTDDQAEPVIRALAAAGVEAVNVPAIEIDTAGPDGELDRSLLAAVPGDLVVVTSANSARIVLEAAARLRVDTAAFRWAAVGATTAEVLRDHGLDDVFRPTRADADTLAAELPLRPDDRVLLPRADIAEPGLPAALRARGATVTDVVAYRTLVAPASSARRLADALDDGPIDAVIATSASVVRGLLALAADDLARDRLLAAPVVAIGAPSADAARAIGFGPVLVAPSPVAEDLAAFVAGGLGFTDSRASVATGGPR